MMHKGGSLGIAKAKEVQEMYEVALQEKAFLIERKKRIDRGLNDYDRTKLNIDRSMFEAKYRKITSRLSILNDHTLETKAVNVDVSSSSEDDLEDEEIFTDDDDDRSFYDID